MIRKEQTEVDEERLKAMIAGEVSSYRKPDVVNPEVSKEKMIPAKEEGKAERYESLFLIRKESVHR